MEKLDRMRQGYMDLAAAGDISREEMLAGHARIEERRAEVRRLLAAPAALSRDQALGLLALLGDEAMPIPQKRDRLRLAVTCLLPTPTRAAWTSCWPHSRQRRHGPNQGANQGRWKQGRWNQGLWIKAMSLYAELHRHLGGAVVPRVFWRYLLRNAHPLAAEFPEYESFEAFVTRPRASLAEYLELHALVEPFQTLETLPYFVSKLVRGAYVFEGICYLELRHTPFYRTDPALCQADKIAQMRDVVVAVGEAGHDPRYPLLMRQILCMHSQLPYEVNRATLDLAERLPQYVCGVDLAGPDIYYANRLDEWVGLFRSARERGINTTGHLYETPDGCHPALLPYLSRIGHGIQIALRFPELLPEVAARGQCLEVCPTTYLKTGTLSDLSTLRTVFERCEAAGVDVVICTDNAGLHNVRLPWEYENLLTQDVIDFSQLAACQDAAFRHAFAWPHPHPPRVLLDQLIQSPPPPAGNLKGEPLS